MHRKPVLSHGFWFCIFAIRACASYNNTMPGIQLFGTCLMVTEAGRRMHIAEELNSR
jgi:hypothetical protein